MDLFLKLFQSPSNDIVINPDQAGMEINESHFPYIMVTMHQHYIHSRQIRYFLTKMGEIYHRAVVERQRIVLILDTRKLDYAKAKFAYDLAKWFLSVRTTTSRYVLCTIILSENEGLKNFINKWVFTFVKRTRPNYICATIHEAWIWLILYLHSQAQAGTLHYRMNSLEL